MTAAVAVFLVISLDFVFLEVLPGDPTRLLAPRGGYIGPGGGPNLRLQVVSQWGLDRPLLDRYMFFLGNILSGNWGISTSFRPGASVWDLIQPALAPTIGFAGIALFLTALAGTLLGRFAGRRRQRISDSAATSVSLLGISIPAIGLALGLLLVLAFHFPILPIRGDTSLNYPTLDPLGQLWDRIYHGILPVATVVATSFGLFALFARDFESARSPVARPPRSQSRLRSWLDASPPVLGGIGLFAGWVLGIELLAETQFGIRGLGTLLLTSLNYLDFFVMSGVFLLTAFGLIAIVTVADVLVAALSRSGEVQEFVAARPGRVPVLDQFRRLAEGLLRPMGRAGLSLVVFFAGFSSVASLWVGPYTSTVGAGTRFQPPSAQHFLGTDGLGRDVWALLAYAGQTPLLAALYSFLLAVGLGVLVAVALGYVGDWVGAVVDEATFVFLFLSWIPFVILFAIGAFRDSIQSVAVLGTVLVAWPIPVRFIRSDIVQRYPEATRRTRTRSAGWGRLTDLGHFLLNVAPTILGSALFAACFAVLMESTLAFFGLSGQPVPSWGSMIYESIVSPAVIQGFWWTFVPPVVFVAGASFGFALLGFALKETPSPVPVSATVGPSPDPLRSTGQDVRA